MNKILFTGGGSAGHVSVNVALIPEFKKHGYQISYIGSKKGIEKEMIENINDVKYHAISSGKLRRYFSWENFIDPFRFNIYYKKRETRLYFFICLFCKCSCLCSSTFIKSSCCSSRI